MADEIQMGEALIDEKTKGDTIDLVSDLQHTERKKFMAKLYAIYKDHTENKKQPYDYQAAKREFERYQDEQIQKSGFSKKYKIADNVPYANFDFNKYGDKNRFVFQGEQPCNEFKLMDGIRVQVQTGTFKNYKAKESGNQFSIFNKLESAKK